MRLQIYLVLIFLLSYGIVLCQDTPTRDYNFNSSQKIEVDTLNNIADTSNASSSYSNVDQVLGDIDSLKHAILSMHQEINFLRSDLTNVQINLKTSHKRFRLGAILLGAGVAGFFIGVSSIEPKATSLTSGQQFLIFGGLGATVTGIVFIINSHKYIGKAGVNMMRYSRNIRRE